MTLKQSIYGRLRNISHKESYKDSRTKDKVINEQQTFWNIIIQYLIVWAILVKEIKYYLFYCSTMYIPRLAINDSHSRGHITYNMKIHELP